MLEGLNAHQQLAVKNFLTRKSQEPYILIGPSGEFNISDSHLFVFTTQEEEIYKLL